MQSAGVTPLSNQYELHLVNVKLEEAIILINRKTRANEMLSKSSNY